LIPNKALVAIGAITAIVITCIIYGVNGWIVAIGCSLIAGLGGFVIGKTKK
jgi:hypothetical protein